MPVQGGIENDRLREQIRQARTENRSLEIRGHGSKAFLGVRNESEVLSSLALNQVVSYEPSELVITVQSGLELNALEALLAENHQRLAFEPPMFSSKEGERRGTVGGMLASALAGPRRPWSGGVRDAVLGLQMINGEGELLNFGGQVMKNVAGYDVSRLMCGAMGCLGFISQVSLKVLPAPQAMATVTLDESRDAFLGLLQGWQQRMSPISGAAHEGQVGWLRLEGSHSNINAFLKEHAMTADIIAQDNRGLEVNNGSFWEQLRDLRGPFFEDSRPLWRLSLPPGTLITPEMLTDADVMLDWGGAQYWIKTEDEQALESLAVKLKGHLCAYDARKPRHFPALPPAIMKLHQNLKQAYDAGHVFNRGRMYAEF